MDNNNYSTLDRLLEFGMGMGMAQQMVNMMNQTMQTMQLPESSRPVQSAAKEWFFVFDDKASGPYNEIDVKRLLLEKKVTKDTLTWSVGMSQWQKVETTPSMLRFITQLPPSL